jgi:hypothetical protein
MSCSMQVHQREALRVGDQLHAVERLLDLEVLLRVLEVEEVVGLALM